MRKFPKPAIRSAEFEFELKYELYGKTIVVQDVLVCEYRRIEWNTNVGWHRVYNKYIKSDKKTKDIMLFELEKGLNLYYDTGYPAFYMGETEQKKDEKFNFVYSAQNDHPTTSRKFYNNKSYEDFGIVFISWTIDPPIQNNFE